MVDTKPSRAGEMPHRDASAWVDDALGVFERAEQGAEGFRARFGRHRLWSYDDLGPWILQVRRPPPTWVRVVVAIWPLGVLTLIWAVFGLRSYEVNTLGYGLGAVLTLAGAFGIAALTVHERTPQRRGVVLHAEGVVVVDGAGATRAIPRPQVGPAGCEGHRVWMGDVEVAGDDAYFEDGMAADVVEMLDRWRGDGLLRKPESFEDFVEVVTGRHARYILVAAFIGVAVMGFTWLTLVMPATSEAGLTARAFVVLAAAGDQQGVYDLVLEEKRGGRSPAALFDDLPAPMKTAEGLSVNELQYWSGPDGEEACVDGWFEGNRAWGMLSIDLVERDGAWRVSDWRPRPCPMR